MWETCSNLFFLVFITTFITESGVDAYDDGVDAYDEEYDEYDPNDIPIEQAAPDGYGAPPPAEYELPDYEVPDYEAPAEEEIVEDKSVEEEYVPAEVEGNKTSLHSTPSGL